MEVVAACQKYQATVALAKPGRNMAALKSRDRTESAGLVITQNQTTNDCYWTWTFLFIAYLECNKYWNYYTILFYMGRLNVNLGD